MKVVALLKLQIFILPFLLYLLTFSQKVCSTKSTRNNFPKQLGKIEGKIDNSVSQEFTKYKLVTPVLYDNHLKKEITRKIDKLYYQHPDDLTIFLFADNKELILDVVLNKPLISKNYFIETQKDGVNKITTAKKKSKLCHYTGKIRNKTNSLVAISTCKGLSGVIYDSEETYFIEKNIEKNVHVLYKNENLMMKNSSCDYTEKEKFDVKQNFRFTRDLSGKKNLIQEPDISNTDSRYVELVLVIDNQKYVELNSSIENVDHFSKNIANIMNRVYLPLNIFITLVGVVVWTENDEIELSEDGDLTLKNFLQYRRKHLLQQHPNDNAQLITKQSFGNGIVGKALKGPICTSAYSGGVTTDHSTINSFVATSVAHMLGHNFGMEHDTEDCECPDELCIMSSKVGTVVPTHWSSCSQKYLHQAFNHGMDHCLKNLPETFYKGPICGNGFVEQGEECDCGLPEHCKNPCCNATTCKLEATAKCATGSCCDLKTCSLKKPGIPCRTAVSECDMPEYCTGKDKHCPADVFRLDAESCDEGKGHCYQGHCGSNSLQCKLLWGPTGAPSDDVCYQFNVKGNRHGNCGYNFINETYVKCKTEDTMCGRLFCKHAADNLLYGHESVSILSHSFISQKGAIIACRNALVDLGINDFDPGMVPNGAVCGVGKMCLNQKCVAVTSVQEGRTCPHDCYNNGYCNNLGHCHCDAGYLLPDCQFLSPGGSVDSGPAYVNRANVLEL